MDSNFYRVLGKRLCDLTVSLPALVVLSPALALIALVVRFDSPGPALFVQERLGRNGRVFRAYKFRTMFHRPRTGCGEVIGKTDEVTAVGYWLRRFKLDELLQLWNVAAGDMSLVGPRPALPAQIREYDERSRRRLLVRPGLTGLAQIHGNIHLTWPERWLYDCEYVDRLSFFLDVWILARTIGVVLVGEETFLRRVDAGERPRGDDSKPAAAA
jgi:lipopolysaccharide/colanic/teichoic acid biosynthesis glycosyltransferase